MHSWISPTKINSIQMFARGSLGQLLYLLLHKVRFTLDGFIHVSTESSELMVGKTACANSKVHLANTSLTSRL